MSGRSWPPGGPSGGPTAPAPRPSRRGLGSIGPAIPRLVAVWAGAAPSAVLLVVIVVALTSFLATAAPLWFVQAADRALPTLLDGVSAGQSGLEFEQSGRIDPGATDPLSGVTAAGAALRADLPESLARIVTPTVDVVDSPELLAIDPPQAITRLTFRIEPAIADAIRFYAGRAPTGHTGTIVRSIFNTDAPWPVYEVALSRTSAAVLKLGVGDQLALVPDSNRYGYAGAEIVGLFDVIDPADPRWFGDTTLDIPSEQRLTSELSAFHAIGLLSPDAYPTLVGTPPITTFRYRWRLPVAADRLAGVGIDRLATDLARLDAAHPFHGSGLEGAAGLSTGLAPLLELYASQRTIAATALALASVGAVVASFGALALVSAAMTRRRAGTIRLARARGADLRRLLVIQLVEAAVLVVPAAALGAVAAMVVVTGGLSDGAPGAVLVALAGVVLLTVDSLGTARGSLAGGRRQTERTINARNRRRVLDGLVVIVAVATALGLRSATTAAPDDPVRAAAPALFAVAGAIVLIRLFDGAAIGLAWVGRRARGFAGTHAVRGLARGPRTHELPLLVLLVAVAAGVFSTSVASAIDRTQALAAAVEVGADYRIEPAHVGQLPANFDLTALVAIGPTALVARDTGSLLGISRTGQPVDVIGLDAAAYATVTAGQPMAPTFPPGFVDPGPVDGTAAHPLPVVVAGPLAADTGLAPGSVVRLAIGTHEAACVVVGVGDLVPATAMGRGIMAPLAALKAAFPDRVLAPAQVFVRATPADRPAIDKVMEPYVAGLHLAVRSEVEASLRAAPLADTMAIAFLAALVITAAYAAVVVGAAMSQAVAMRSAELSLLRALGVSSRGAAGILLLELGSTIVVALAGGLLLGLGTAALVVPGLGVERFVGTAVAAAPAVDPPALAVALLGPAVAGLAGIGLVVRAMGTSAMAEWIRSAET